MTLQAGRGWQDQDLHGILGSAHWSGQIAAHAALPAQFWDLAACSHLAVQHRHQRFRGECMLSSAFLISNWPPKP